MGLTIDAGVQVLIFEAAIRIRGYFFALSMGPYVEFDLLPSPQTCFGIKGTFDPMKIEIDFMWRILLCIDISFSWCCSVSISIHYCQWNKLRNYYWSTPKHHFYLLGPLCTNSGDETPPGILTLSNLCSNGLVQLDLALVNSSNT